MQDVLNHEGVLTPSESIMSLGNLYVWASRGPYLPDKLQIVKPLEGKGGERLTLMIRSYQTMSLLEKKKQKNKNSLHHFLDCPLLVMIVHNNFQVVFFFLPQFEKKKF